MGARTLLFEIGTEELPSSFVEAALQALPDLVAARLDERRIAHGAVRALGTPRRLAILALDVSETQSDVDEEVVGPPETAAFKDGKPTRAAEAFAEKLGVALTSLAVVAKEASGKQRAGRFVVGRKIERGGPAQDLLGELLGSAAAKIPFRKSMRWGSGDATFGRPVQWLVALFGSEEIDLSFAGVRSGRVSRGHRFLAPARFELESADAYAGTLRRHHVLVDPEERASAMMEAVSTAARALGGLHDEDTMLVMENTSLVEWPHVVAGSFDPRFLALPAAVIRSVARGHQRYFCVQKDQDTLLPHYLAVANTALAPAKVKLGNDRVMRARLADAEFFFEEDKKADLESRLEKTGTIVFHARLGTVRDKVARVEALCGEIATRLSVADVAPVLRAAHLAKFDLVSLMVGEFPELQGHMGRAYARHAGEAEAICDAIRDHYRPVHATDDVPPSDVSRIVALADRLDTLTGCFAIGLAPTGAADPFGLRRACIAILRILLDVGAADRRYGELCVADLVGLAHDRLSGGGDGGGRRLDLGRAETIEKVREFAKERLRGVLAQRSTPGVADALLAGYTHRAGRDEAVVDFPALSAARARGLHAAVIAGSPWLATAKAVGKRLSGISKNTPPVLHPAAAFARTEADAAKNRPILDLVGELDAVTRALDTDDAVDRALEVLPKVANGLERVFVSTLVNDPADDLTPRRLEVLSYGAACMMRVCDFTRLLQSAG